MADIYKSLAQFGTALNDANYSERENSTNKLQRLQEARNQKLDNLNQQASLEDSYTLLDDGRIESNANKIYNDRSPLELQAVFGDVFANQQLEKRDDGKIYKIGTDEEFKGKTARLYGYGTKDDPNAVKIGIASGDFDSSDARYTPGSGTNGKYGWESGAKGVDKTKNLFDVLLPANVATSLEATIHGNKNALNNRISTDSSGVRNTQLTKDYGSGVTEYYKDLDSVFGDTSGATKEEIDKFDASKAVDTIRRIRGAQAKGEEGFADTKTLTYEDFVDYNENKSTSGFGALEAYLRRSLAIPTANIQGLIKGENDAESRRKRKEYIEENADYLSGYDTSEMGNFEKVRRAAASGTENVANKAKALFGEAVETVGEGLDKLIALERNFLEKDQKRLDKYYPGEEISEFRYELLDALGDEGVSKWLKETGKNIQKATTEFDKDVKGSRFSGYDTTDMSQLMEDIDKTIEEDGYITAIANTVTDARSLQALGQSVPEMIALMFSVGTMAVANANHNINIAEDNMGRGLTPDEKVKSVAVSVIGTYLDRMGDKLALNGMNPSKLVLKEAIEKAPAGVKQALATTYGKSILKISEAPVRLALAGATEGITEFAQTLSEEAAQNPIVFTDGFSEEQWDEAKGSGVIGAAMGIQMATPRVAYDTTKGSASLAKEVKAKAIELSERAKTPKEEKVTSTSKEESLNRAKAFGIEGKTDILGSSMSMVEKTKNVQDAITTLEENGLLTEDVINNIKGMVSKEDAKLDVDDMVRVSSDINKLKKTANDVSREASEGARGFLTYYNKAKEAEVVGDTKEVENNIVKIESFIKSQEDKLETFRAVEKEILAEYKTYADEAGITMREMYDKVKDSTARHKYTYGDNNREATVKKKAVLEKYITGNADFKGDAYAYISRVEDEIDTMKRLHNKLTGNLEPVIKKPAAERAVVRNPMKRTVKKVRPKTTPVEKAKTSSESVNKKLDELLVKYNYDKSKVESIIENNPKGTKEQKEAAVKYVRSVKSPERKEEPVVEKAKEAKNPTPVKESTKEVKEPKVVKENTKEETKETRPAKATDKELKTILNIYLEEGRPTKTGGMIMDERVEADGITKVSSSDEDVAKGTIMKGISTPSIREMLPELGKVQINRYARAYKMLVEERKRPTRVDKNGNVIETKPYKEAKALLAEFRDLVTRINESEEVREAFYGTSNVEDVKTTTSDKGLDVLYEAQVEATDTKAPKSEVREAENNATESDVDLNEVYEAMTKAENDQAKTTPKPKQEKSTDVQELTDLYARQEELQLKKKQAEAAEDSETVSKIDEELATIKDKLSKKNNTVYKTLANKTVVGPIVGNKKGSYVFTPTKLTGLSIKEDVDSVNAVESLKNVVMEAPIKKDGTLALNKSDNPALYLIYNEDGTVNERVALAIDIAAVNYRKELEESIALLDDEEFQERFGTVDVIATVAEHGFYNRATPLRFEAEKVGRDILKNLGIGVKDNVSMTYEASLVSDLGMVAIATLANNDYVRIGKINPKDPISPYAISIGNNYNTLSLDMRALEYENTYGIEATKKRTYSLTKPKEGRSVGIRNQELGSATKEEAKMIEKQESMEYRLNEGFDVITEIFSKEELKTALGFKKKYSSHYKKEAQKSVDREIENSVDSLYELASLKDKNGNNKGIYFNWFLSSNRRFNLDSTTVNPQTDKLHRFLVTSGETEITANTITDISKDKSGTKKAVAFKYAIVQAFDGAKGIPAIDKKSRAEIEEAANKLISLEEAELKAMLKEADHIGHAAIAISAIRRLKEGKPFNTGLTVEFDGLTNGFAFRMLQFPMGDYGKWLPKVGVIPSDSRATSMAQLKSKGMLDTYEEIGALVEFEDVVKTRDKNSAIRMLLEIKALPDTTNKEAVRKLMKPPVMVFNYGAGKDSIIRAITEEILQNAVEVLSTNTKVQKALGLEHGLLRTAPISDPRLAPVINEIRAEIESVYAKPITEALIEEFKEVSEVNNAINKAFNIMYKGMNKEVIENMKEYFQGMGLPSRVEMEKATKKALKKGGPRIKGPLSESIEDGVLVTSRAVVDIKELTPNGRNTIISSAKINESHPSISLVVRGIGEPGAAGGVIPIHASDGATQGRTIMASKGYLGVHDAMVVKLDDVDNAAVYNKEWYSLNKEYSIIDEVIKELEKIDDSVDGKVKTLRELKDLKETIDYNRAQIFNQEHKIGQMVGLPGSTYVTESDSIKAKKPKEQAEEVQNEVTESSILSEFENDTGVNGHIIKSVKDC